MEYNDYDPIADLYDVYVPASFDIDFFVRECQPANGEVLELMSGTGRVSIPLLEAGVKLTCVDLSAELNAVCTQKLRQRGLQADVYRMDVRELELHKQFARIIIPFHSFAHLTTPADQRRALAGIRRHLAPGGAFICTLGNPLVRQKSVDGQLRLLRKYPFPDRPGELLLWSVEKFNAADAQIVEAMQFYEEYDARGVLQNKRLLELHFRLTRKDEFEQLAREAGFRIRAMYGDYSYTEFNADSPYMIWLLE